MAQSIAGQYLPVNRHVLACLNHLLDFYGATALNAAAAAVNAGSLGVAGLKTQLQALAVPANRHNQYVPLDKNWEGDTLASILSALDAGKSIGTFTDTLVNAQTTWAGIIGLCTTQDPLLDVGYRAHFNYAW